MESSKLAMRSAQGEKELEMMIMAVLYHRVDLLLQWCQQILSLLQARHLVGEDLIIGQKFRICE